MLTTQLLVTVLAAQPNVEVITTDSGRPVFMPTRKRPLAVARKARPKPQSKSWDPLFHVSGAVGAAGASVALGALFLIAYEEIFIKPLLSPITLVGLGKESDYSGRSKAIVGGGIAAGVGVIGIVVSQLLFSEEATDKEVYVTPNGAGVRLSF